MKKLIEKNTGKTIMVHDIDAIELLITGAYELDSGEYLPAKVVDVVNARRSGDQVKPVDMNHALPVDVDSPEPVQDKRRK